VGCNWLHFTRQSCLGKGAHQPPAVPTSGRGLGVSIDSATSRAPHEVTVAYHACHVPPIRLARSLFSRRSFKCIHIHQNSSGIHVRCSIHQHKARALYQGTRTPPAFIMPRNLPWLNKTSSRSEGRLTPARAVSQNTAAGNAQDSHATPSSSRRSTPRPRSMIYPFLSS